MSTGLFPVHRRNLHFFATHESKYSNKTIVCPYILVKLAAFGPTMSKMLDENVELTTIENHDHFSRKHFQVLNHIPF